MEKRYYIEVEVHGKWQVGEIPCLTREGAEEVAEIDNYIVFDVHAARKLVKRAENIPYLPKFLKTIWNHIDREKCK